MLKRISIVKTKKNIGIRNVSSAMVVSSTNMVKAGNVINPLGISKDCFIMESKISGVSGRFHNVQQMYDMSSTRGGSVINVSGENIPRINLRYNTEDIFNDIDQLDDYNHLLTNIPDGFLEHHFSVYYNKLISLKIDFFNNFRDIKKFCSQFGCEINLQTNKHSFSDPNKMLDYMKEFLDLYTCSLEEFNLYRMDSTNITFCGAKPENIYDILPKIRELILNMDSWAQTFNNLKSYSEYSCYYAHEGVPVDSFLDHMDLMLTISHLISY